MLDCTRIAMLRDDFGEEGFAEVIEIFAEETRPVIAGLPGSTDLAADLHFIKGGAENMGFRELSLLCKRGEQAVRQGGDVQIDAIVECFDASLVALNDNQIRNSESVASSVMSR
ncbi:Hpt domain-containing protein [Palleronia aestuarii]|uniref:Hpt domain-containing protein n=1 Tax=Palleronia aestuarii TaxID=568105 RepID=A0A2W7NQN9_9RHOB|nr:Hpt domain-containing protein [Palleronia aestuarii]PZX18954.1 Hpt domain-containing protein [Palleronia aestuarii]